MFQFMLNKVTVIGWCKNITLFIPLKNLQGAKNLFVCAQLQKHSNVLWPAFLYLLKLSGFHLY